MVIAPLGKGFYYLTEVGIIVNENYTLCVHNVKKAGYFGDYLLQNSEYGSKYITGYDCIPVQESGDAAHHIISFKHEEPEYVPISWHYPNYSGFNSYYSIPESKLNVDPEKFSSSEEALNNYCKFRAGIIKSEYDKNIEDIKSQTSQNIKAEIEKENSEAESKMEDLRQEKAKCQAFIDDFNANLKIYADILPKLDEVKQNILNGLDGSYKGFGTALKKLNSAVENLKKEVFGDFIKKLTAKGNNDPEKIATELTMTYVAKLQKIMDEFVKEISSAQKAISNGPNFKI